MYLGIFIYYLLCIEMHRRVNKKMYLCAWKLLWASMIEIIPQHKVQIYCAIWYKELKHLLLQFSEHFFFDDWLTTSFYLLKWHLFNTGRNFTSYLNTKSFQPANLLGNPWLEAYKSTKIYDWSFHVKGDGRGTSDTKSPDEMLSWTNWPIQMSQSWCLIISWIYNSLLTVIL